MLDEQPSARTLGTISKTTRRATRRPLSLSPVRFILESRRTPSPALFRGQDVRLQFAPVGTNSIYYRRTSDLLRTERTLMNGCVSVALYLEGTEAAKYGFTFRSLDLPFGRHPDLPVWIYPSEPGFSCRHVRYRRRPDLPFGAWDSLTVGRAAPAVIQGDLRL